MFHKVWTGPCWLDQMEARFTRLVNAAGGEVFAGTEHLCFKGLTREEITRCFKLVGFKGWTVGSGLRFTQC